MLEASSHAPAFFLVIDLEATCDDAGAVPRDEMEILEIGAVLVDAVTLEAREEFQTFVRPVRHPRLTPFCTRLTTLVQADVDNAPGFVEALAALTAFVDGRDALFCSWGDYDRNQFAQDAAFHGCALPFGGRHWNVKRAFAHTLGARPEGVSAALRRVGLTFQGTLHRGIDDARNIARLLPWALGRHSERPRAK